MAVKIDFKRNGSVPNSKTLKFLDAHLGKQGWAQSKINGNIRFKICEALLSFGPLVTAMIIQLGPVSDLLCSSRALLEVLQTRFIK